MQGYVTQEDVLIGTLTVRETIQYSARLRFPDKLSPKELKEIVDSTIVEMGLYECQNTRVGTFFVRGISGGEKRRLSIALHILTRPHLLFLDEPTSGLDSAAAYFVVQTLKNLAKGGRTLICSIHQPSNEVFQLFDSLVLLSSGRTIFFGERESVTEHFATAGFPCPPLRNPSDHFLHTINADFDQVKSILRNLTKGAMDVEVGEPSVFGNSSTKQAVTKLLKAYESSEYAARAISKVQQITTQIVCA
jgi:ABC-type multidrug transport system ATPase subunit